jgi:sulfite reductase (NADPH) flavoprotein alpha-component
MSKILKYTLKDPFLAPITKVIPLNKKGSTKANNHLEISISGSNIEYEVGASFGLLPQNKPSEVDRILDILGASKEFTVSSEKLSSKISVYDFFLNHVNLQRVTKKIADALIPFQRDEKLLHLLEKSWTEYTKNHDLVEFLEEFYVFNLEIQTLINLVSPSLPRFYSVASSQKVVGDNVHLLVADFKYLKGKKEFRSLTTEHILTKNSIRLFHQVNPSFKLPSNDIPIIMIGPGTGIAAFRGFLQERVFNGCKNNLLFTGDRNQAFDFYYEEELKKYQDDGYLELFTAFSRDTLNKIYVQDRMWEQREKLYELIMNKGAEIFLSGDAHYMAKDVVFILEKIYSYCSNLSPQNGHEFIKDLKKAKRLHLDVY